MAILRQLNAVIDNTSKSVKTVPSGVDKADVLNFSGKSVKFRQMIQGFNSWSAESGVTMNVTDDRNVVISAPQYLGIKLGGIEVKQNHKYYVRYTALSSVENHIELVVGFANKLVLNVTSLQPKTAKAILTNTSGTQTRTFYFNGGSYYVNSLNISDFNMFDLTEIYGEGNEPTIEEFEAMFPAEYYPYNEGEILHGAVDSVDVVGKNLVTNVRYLQTIKKFNPLLSSLGANVKKNIQYVMSFDTPNIPGYEIYAQSTPSGLGIAYTTFVLDGERKNISFNPTLDCDISIAVLSRLSETDETPVYISNLQIERGTTATPYTPYKADSYPIPDEIKNLEDYGWGINDEVRNYVDFERGKYVQMVGRVDLGSLTWFTQKILNETYRVQTNDIRDLIKPTTTSAELGNAICKNYTIVSGNSTYQSQNGLSIENNGQVSVYDVNYNTSESATNFKNAMSGVMLYYELATPIETDISAIMPVFDVMEGDTITFNQDILIDIPNTIKYDTTTPSYDERLTSNYKLAVQNGLIEEYKERWCK